MSQQKLQCLLYCFFLVLQQIFAQNSQVDSLRGVLYDLHNLHKLSSKSTDYKNKKVEILRQILDIRMNAGVPQDSLLSELDDLANLYKELKDDKKYKEFSLEKKAIVYVANAKNLEALALYKKYVEYLVTVKREKENGYLYINIGNVYMDLRLYKSANNYYKKAEDIFQTQKKKDGLATTYSCYSFVAMHLKDFDASAKYARLGFDLAIENSSDFYSIAYQRFILGRALQKVKKHQEAKVEFMRALKIFMDSVTINGASDEYGKINSLNMALELVRVCTEEKQYDSVGYYMQVAKDIFVKYNITDQNSEIHLYYMEMVALTHQKKYKAAIEIAQKLLQKFPLLPSNETLNQYKYSILLAISETYAQVGDSIKMYEFGYKAEQFQKTFQKNTAQDDLMEINNIILQMENEQTISTQQQSILEKEKVAEQDRFFRRILIGIIMGICLIMGIIGGLAWQLKRQNKLIQNYATQMEESDQNKALLLSVIGHDLRAPFNTIFRSLQLANLKKNEAGVQKYLDQIAVASRGAFVMLDNLMQWISVQKEDFKTKEKLESLAVLFKEILLPIEALAFDNQIIIKQELEIEYLDCDRDLLQIILRNLLFNAIKHSFAQGIVSIKTYLKEDQVCLSIANDGEQVSASFLNEIKSLQNNRNIAKKGSGLGLFLVQTIAQKLGIHFMIENQEKGGVLCTLIFKKGINYSENSIKSEPQIKKEIEAIKWTSEEQNYIQKISLKLQEYPIFEATEIKKILQEQHEAETENIQYWKKQIAQAVYKMDELLFLELTNLI